MKDNSANKKHKRTRSSSNSSAFTISDDDSPKQSTLRDRKSSEERFSRRKHHYKHNRKHHRQHSSESSSNDEGKLKHKSVEKDSRHRVRSPDQIRVKEEPASENEREQRHKVRHNNHSRITGDTTRRGDSRNHREDFRRKTEHSESRSGNSRGMAVKDEPKSEAEPEWGKKEVKKEKEPAKNNAKPDFGLSGKLTEDANTFNGVVIKYSEPPEARKPKRRWRLYPFKGETSLPVLHIHRQSAYLLGRDRKVADIPIDHPSCSKQHAALQYRLVPFTRPDGSKVRQIKLYVIDLESANGTFLNNSKIESKKYYELKERDVVKFGFSSREYVILHEHSKDSENDDDVNIDD